MTAPHHPMWRSAAVAGGVPELRLVARLHVDLLRVASARCRSAR